MNQVTCRLLVKFRLPLLPFLSCRSCVSWLRMPRGSTQAAGAGIEPADPWFKATDFYQQKLPRSEGLRVKGRGSSDRTSLIGDLGPWSLDPCPSTRQGVLRGSRTRLAGLEARNLCRSAKGTTSCGGRNRTCVGAVNSRLPVPARDPPQCQSARLESNQHLRAPEARGLSVSPTRRKLSAQRESNPLFRPGKAAGCRYIMGACQSRPNCQ